VVSRSSTTTPRPSSGDHPHRALQVARMAGADAQTGPPAGSSACIRTSTGSGAGQVALGQHDMLGALRLVGEDRICQSPP
jgi:hypothetical protein